MERKSLSSKKMLSRKRALSPITIEEDPSRANGSRESIPKPKVIELKAVPDPLHQAPRMLSEDEKRTTMAAFYSLQDLWTS
jgi:hypothetical protein